MSDWLEESDALLNKEEADQAKMTGAKTWKPEAGEVLKGTLINGAFVDSGKGYGPCRVLSVEDADGQVWSVWAGNKLLEEAVTTQAPAIGKGISIKYGGVKEPSTPAGRQYKAFFMACEASDHEFWHNVIKAHYAEAEEKNPARGSGIPTDGLADPF